MQRFPWFGLVLTAMASLAASVVLFQAGLPETRAEWLDTNSARVMVVRHVMCFKLAERAALPELARLHDRYAGAPETDWHWVNTNRSAALPDWLKWAGSPAPGAVRSTTREIYTMLELCLPAQTPHRLNDQGELEELQLPPRLTPAAQQALIDRTLEVAELSHSPLAAADYAFEVFQIMQARSGLEPEDLPSAEGFYFSWRLLSERGS